MSEETVFYAYIFIGYTLNNQEAVSPIASVYLL